eukprot:TRINITY_DN21576_c0_g1_i1.p1 TRINITY_DN21576_c0_g1~~TRINITY_DN21576_c0_g1_i1.p1  ORF type:complete len:303 (-),score=51.30 TRINITY_DN21576_c0_g1_i1:134-1042(-)
MACGFGASAVRALTRKLAAPRFRGSSSTAFAEPQAADGDLPGSAGLQAPKSRVRTLSTSGGSFDERGREGTSYNDHEESDSDDASEPEGPEIRTRTLTFQDVPDPEEFLDPQRMSAYAKLYFEEDGASNYDSEADGASKADTPPRTRTMTFQDIPDPEEFLDPQRISAYAKLYFDEDGASNSDSEADVASNADTSQVAPKTRTRTMTLQDVPDPGEFVDPKLLSAYAKLYGDDDSASNSDSGFGGDSNADTSQVLPSGIESDCEEMYTGPLKPTRTTARKDFPSPSEYLSEEELTSALKFFA